MAAAVCMVFSDLEGAIAHVHRGTGFCVGLRTNSCAALRAVAGGEGRRGVRTVYGQKRF